jgi:hypothetical protein
MTAFVHKFLLMFFIVCLPTLVYLLLRLTSNMRSTFTLNYSRIVHQISSESTLSLHDCRTWVKLSVREPLSEVPEGVETFPNLKPYLCLKISGKSNDDLSAFSAILFAYPLFLLFPSLRRRPQCCYPCLIIIMPEHIRPCHEEVGSLLSGFIRGLFVDAAVHLDVKRRVEGLGLIPEAGDFFKRSGNELLSAKSGEHGHDERLVDEREMFDKQGDRLVRIDRYPGLDAALSDTSEDRGKVVAYFGMHDEDRGAGVAEIADVFCRIGDHEVNVERNGHAAPYRLHNQRAEGDVGNKIAVHHVAVDTVRARVLRRLDFTLETAEISGKDGGKDLDPGRVHIIIEEVRGSGDREQETKVRR